MDARVADSLTGPADPGGGHAPILLFPYTWVGDFVRCHTVVRLLKQRWPSRPIDLVSTSLTAPLADYMPGVRNVLIADVPHRQFDVATQLALIRRMRQERYGSAFIMSRKWKIAVAPFLAGIPERVGYIGELRLLLLNRPRWDENRLPRFIEKCAALVWPKGEPLPSPLPPPQLVVPQTEIAAWRARRGLEGEQRIAVLAPGAVGASKRWPPERYGEFAASLARDGWTVWALGGPAEAALVAEVNAASGGVVRDFTGRDLRDAVLAIGCANLVVSNDSGLMHVAAAMGVPTIGIFGPTSAWHWAPLNGLVAAVASETPPPCQPCHKPYCRMGHHACMRDIAAEQVLAAARAAFAPAVAEPA